VLSFQEVSALPLVENPEKKVNRALDNPIGSEKIEEMARPGMKAVVLFDDWQRPTPAYLVFPEILGRLNGAGIPDSDVTAICALETHPPMSREDIRRKIGRVSYERLFPRIFNHDARSPENVAVGKSSYGTFVRVNPYVFESDLRIGIGTCVPHPWAGFGGGTKLVMPGVCGQDTIAQHHLKWLQTGEIGPGRIEGNRFLEEQEEIAEIVGFDFKIDFILNDEKEPVKIFAGNPVEEHKKAAIESLECCKIDISGQSDVSITSAFPLEKGLQSLKGLGTAVRATKVGGYIIWMAPQEDGERLIPIWEEVASKKSAAEYMEDLLSGNYPPKCEPLGISLLITIHYLKQITKKFSRIVHVTKGIPIRLVEAMGFSYATSIEEAIDIVQKEVPEGNVSIFPSGGSVFPVLSD